MRRTASLGLLLILLGPLACRSTGPPVPPPPVNAVFGESIATHDVGDQGHRGPLGDTRLTVRCRSYDKFAERKRGDWITTWYVVRCDVVSVDCGTWPDAELSFTCGAKVPTPESGIMLDIVWLYPPGKVWVFELDTRSQPARIVGRYAPPDSEQGIE
jgi:hypothetical protein